MKLGHLDKAEENLQRASKDNIAKLAPLIKAAEADIAAAKPKPQPVAPPPVSPPPTPPTRPAETRPSEKPEEKPAEPAKPAINLRAMALIQEGQAILKEQEGRLSEAKSKFLESQRIQALPAAQDGLAEIQRREREYARLKAAADQDRTAGRAATAVQKYLQAHDLNPEQYKADNLAAWVRALQTHAPTPAPAEAPTRVIPPDSPDYSVVPLEEALTEYLKGNVAKTIALLEPAAKSDNGSMDNRVRATLHAYLGAAYADRSLVTRADDERQKLRQQAMSEFAVALQAAPDYQLSESVVSPSVRELMQQAKKKN